MTYKETAETLADLFSGQSGIITKVKGHGAFRKRITEMGFVRGSKVTVIKNAPLQDPIEYEILGYRVSLRRTEAHLIEIVSESQATEHLETPFAEPEYGDGLKTSVRTKSQTINVALVGNPNCGKTTLFNYTTGRHERVGNYGGVTVDLKEASVKKDGYTINITDLPGTYSLSEYSPEELFVREHLTNTLPDIVINVVDASNLERNLYLTTQLIDMNIKVIIALNMYDELEKKGDHFDHEMLGKMLGIPFVPTVGAKGKGIDELLTKIVDVYEDRDPILRHVHLNYGHIIGQSVERIKGEVKKHPQLSAMYYPRYVASKLLENDHDFIGHVRAIAGTEEILALAQHQVEKLEKEYQEKAETILADAKYAFIHGALKETYRPSGNEHSQKVYSIDDVLTHKLLGFPIFLLFMWGMFQATFSIGSYPMDWIDAGVGHLSDWVSHMMPQGPLRDLLVDGIIGGVGGVIIFLPNILILFFCISLMEDTGYMARAAFIMDRIMHKIGLHGKSFIPMLMGFGCNVPAVMATRTLENRKDRILTMLIVPFMSCSARLPVYVLLISAFFPHNQGLVLLSIYAIGVLLATLVAIVMKKLVFAKKEAPFVMELPPYRIPTLRNTTIHMWGKSVQYLSKMGTIILFASILIWALGYYPQNVTYTQDFDAAIAKVEADTTLADTIRAEQINQLTVAQESERMQQSYIGRMGHFIEPVIRPLGFDWKIGVSIITGLAAKEIVVGTMGVLYQSDLAADETTASLHTKLQEQVHTQGPRVGQKVFTPLVAFSMMLFILIYFPCVAVIAAIKREGSWGWAVFTMVYTTALAWMVSFATFQIGSLL
ncbi:ferrous iron transport protein B [Breznakibacter xylanolyticus]|uniref:Ferrous iron transport protein B n=1 Tax=Breznakibacter xylanolyticus TaxID=990 RepID=A0A2W7MX48_9BACT|nr:ferrous iron transport protein B [Breznakibacter xylanolyticus]PZX12221.1 ferrous iron transport protein B [Breznakibacter xylanolyticus]